MTRKASGVGSLGSVDGVEEHDVERKEHVRHAHAGVRCCDVIEDEERIEGPADSLSWVPSDAALVRCHPWRDELRGVTNEISAELASAEDETAKQPESRWHDWTSSIRQLKRLMTIG